MAVYPFSETDLRYPIKAYIDAAIAEAGGGASPEVMLTIGSAGNLIGTGNYGASVAHGGGVGSYEITLDTPHALGEYVATITPVTNSGVAEVNGQIVDSVESPAGVKTIQVFVNDVAADAAFIFILWAVPAA